MTGMPQQTTAWPYPNLSPSAWSPAQGQVVLSIPLYPKDQNLSRQIYLSRLADRVQWLLEAEGNPAEVFSQIVEPKADGRASLDGVNLKQPQSLGHQIVQAWEDLLRQSAGLNQVRFPVRVHNQPQAIQVIQETSLEGWLENLLPPNER